MLTIFKKSSLKKQRKLMLIIKYATKKQPVKRKPSMPKKIHIPSLQVQYEEPDTSMRDMKLLDVET